MVIYESRIIILRVCLVDGLKDGNGIKNPWMEMELKILKYNYFMFGHGNKIKLILETKISNQ